MVCNKASITFAIFSLLLLLFLLYSHYGNKEKFTVKSNKKYEKYIFINEVY
jgi:hypothetical protein